MSDDALRTLEREARATADGQAVLRFAAALDRAGRPAEASAALVAGRDHAAVRVALGARPLDPGPPILSRPVVRWRRKQTGNDPVESFHAGPLGVVLGSKAKVRVLDPDDGSTRFELKGSPFVRVVGDVLLTVRGAKARLEAFDVWTGARLHDVPLAGLGKGTRVVGRWLHVASPEGVTAYDLSDPRRPPSFAWRRPDGPGTSLRRVFGDHGLVQEASGGLRLLDLRTGTLSPVVQREGLWLGAGHGVGLAIPLPKEDGWPIAPVAAYDLADGSRRWAGPTEAWRLLVATSEGFLGAVEPGPAWVLGGSVLIRLDPSGVERERCDLAPAFEPWSAQVNRALPGVGIDYVLRVDGTRVAAWPRGAGSSRGRGKGGVAWVWTGQPSATHVHGAVACRGRLYLHVGRATVVCLEAPP